MIKYPIFILILTIIFAFKASIFAQESALATEGISEPSDAQSEQIKPNLPQTPLDSLWPGDSIRDSVQDWMEKAQLKLEEGAGKASESAQEAIKSEINRQIQKQVRAAKNNLTSAINRVVNTTKEIAIKIFLEIKIFLKEVKQKTFKSNTI